MPTPKKCCIDSCVWVKYAGHFKTTTLLRYIIENNLVVYADNYTDRNTATGHGVKEGWARAIAMVYL